jgi:BirA family transcriptional regulator, biotin operon repressor / biotin---[acetyl-CoA-carboxylase] ligase
MGAPGDLDVGRLEADLGRRWTRVQIVDETASTNGDLLADLAAPDRSVLVAEHQRAGRGRLDRAWVSPRGTGLTFSVLIRPPTLMTTWGWLPLLAGVALVEAVAASTNVPAALKWPNDLLAGEPAGKAAGILVQSSGDAVVIGIGLNVTTAAEELPIGNATSLQLAGAANLDRTQLLIGILDRLAARYDQWCDVAGDAEACGLAAAYQDVCATIGQLVAVTATDGTVQRGVAVGIDPIGRLRLDVDGRDVTIGAGDVHHVRPA